MHPSEGNMDEHHETKLQQLREQVARGEYRVEPTLVADALIRRVQGFDGYCVVLG